MLKTFSDGAFDLDYWPEMSRAAKLSPQLLGYVWYLLSVWFGIISPYDSSVEIRKNKDHKNNYYYNVIIIYDLACEPAEPDKPPRPPFDDHGMTLETIKADLKPFSVKS